MKKLVFIAMLFTVFHAEGQTAIANHSAGPGKKFQIALIASPDFCFRTLKNNDGSEMIDNFISLRNDIEQAKLSYTFGVNAIYHFNNRFSIETGIQYSNKGYQTKKLENEGNITGPESPEQFRNIDHFHALDIPLKMNVTFGKSDLRFFTSLGITTNVFLDETVTYIGYSANRAKKSNLDSNLDIRRIGLSPTISIGMDYKVSASSNLRIEPTFRYSLSKLEDAPMSTYLYSAGLNISYCHGI